MQLRVHTCTGDYVSTTTVDGNQILKIAPEALTMLSEQAFIDISHLLRPAHLQVKLYSYPGQRGGLAGCVLMMITCIHVVSYLSL